MCRLSDITLEKSRRFSDIEKQVRREIGHISRSDVVRLHDQLNEAVAVSCLYKS